jgi:hypothetical protein
MFGISQNYTKSTYKITSFGQKSSVWRFFYLGYRSCPPTMVLEALFTETTSNCHEKKRFSILSLNIYFGEGFPQNSSLRIRWSIKHLFNLTHSALRKSITRIQR